MTNPMRKSQAGHEGADTQPRPAGDPSGHASGDALCVRAARGKSRKFAGQAVFDAQRANAGDPSGQAPDDTLRGSAARENFADHINSDAQEGIVGEASGQVSADNHDALAGGNPHEIAGQLAIDAHEEASGNGAVPGLASADAQVRHARDRATTIASITALHRQNAFACRQRMRINQATLSHIARNWFGYNTSLGTAERKTAMDAAAKLIKDIGKGLDHDAATIVHATALGTKPWDKIEKDTAKAMGKLAKQLPGYAFVQGVTGFGDVSFARIIGETGDLTPNANFAGSYTNAAKIWKRLGLGVYEGHAQRKSVNKEQAMEQGYSPWRRSVVWNAFDPVIRLQKNGGQVAVDAQYEFAADDDSDQLRAEAHEPDVAVDDGNGAGHEPGEAQKNTAGPGPYYAIYATKKAEYLARGEAGDAAWVTKLHCDRAAKRYASKRMLRDLWNAWKLAEVRMA